MSSDKYTLGIDIGGTNFRLGLVSRDGELTAFEKRPSAEISGENAADKLCAAIVDYLKRNGVSVAAVCIGFPAAVDKARTTVLNAPNLAGFDGVSVGSVLSERLGLPVYIEKDVNLLLIADLADTSCEAEDVAACYVGTGIGNAIMIGGRLLVGANGVAGELGHIPFGDGNARCGCGNIGCAECVSGGVYLARLREECFSDTEMGELFTRHGGHPRVAEFLERLSRVIAAEINIIDPEVLLLGGGVIEMADFPKSDFEARILAHVRKPLPHGTLKIMYSPAGDGTSGVRGAGLYAWRKV